MKKAVIILGLVCLFFLSPMLARAQDESIMIGPSDFLPFDQAVEYWQNGQKLSADTGAALRSYYAPIHLPEGVKITRVIIYYYDFHASSDIRFDIRKERMSDGQDMTILHWESTGAASFRRTEERKYYDLGTLYARTIKRNSTYYVQIYFEVGDFAALEFHGMKIFYR